MTIPISPGTQDPILETDEKQRPLPEGYVASDWYLFFQQLIAGDTGNTAINPWNPVAVNLGQTGVPTITGNYYQNQGFTDFWIRIQPGTNTTSTQGVTYFELPFAVSVDSACFVGGTPGAVGLIDSATKRAYPPAWTNSTATLTITGRVVSQ